MARRTKTYTRNVLLELLAQINDAFGLLEEVHYYHDGKHDRPTKGRYALVRGDIGYSIVESLSDRGASQPAFGLGYHQYSAKEMHLYLSGMLAGLLEIEQ